MNARTGETDKLWFRSDRFFIVNGQWYFTTREGIDIGPYTTRGDAAEGLKLFLESVQNPGDQSFIAKHLARKNLRSAALLQ